MAKLVYWEYDLEKVYFLLLMSQFYSLYGTSAEKREVTRCPLQNIHVVSYPKRTGPVADEIGKLLKTDDLLFQHNSAQRYKT
jgi:hypothetical protein